MNRFEECKRDCAARGLSPRYIGVYPMDVKDDVAEWLRGWESVEHTMAEAEWDYLEENDYAIEVKNPAPGGEPLVLEFAGDFTIFFGGWHAHYFSYIYDYEEIFRREAEDLLNNRKCAVVLYDNEDHWHGAALSKKALTKDCGLDAAYAVLGNKNKEPWRLDKGGRIEVNYFDPTKSFVITVPPAGAR